MCRGGCRHGPPAARPRTALGLGGRPESLPADGAPDGGPAPPRACPIGRWSVGAGPPATHGPESAAPGPCGRPWRDTGEAVATVLLGTLPRAERGEGVGGEDESGAASYVRRACDNDSLGAPTPLSIPARTRSASRRVIFVRRGLRRATRWAKGMGSLSVDRVPGCSGKCGPGTGKRHDLASRPMRWLPRHPARIKPRLGSQG